MEDDAFFVQRVYFYMLHYYILLEILLTFVQTNKVNNTRRVYEKVGKMMTNSKFHKLKMYALCSQCLNLLRSMIIYGIISGIIEYNLLYKVWQGSEIITTAFGLESTNEDIVSQVFAVIVGGASLTIKLTFDLADIYIKKKCFKFNNTYIERLFVNALKSAIPVFKYGVGIAAIAVLLLPILGYYLFYLACISVVMFLLPFEFKYGIKCEVNDAANYNDNFIKGLDSLDDELFSDESNSIITTKNGILRFVEVLRFDGLKNHKDINGMRIVTKRSSDNEMWVAAQIHELGHSKQQHEMKLFLVNHFFSLLSCLQFVFISPKDFDILGFPKELNPVICGWVLAFCTVYLSNIILFKAVINIAKRYYEYQADAFVSKYGYEDDLISSLNSIHSQSLDLPVYHYLYYVFKVSQPGFLHRIYNIKKKMDKELIHSMALPV